MRGLRIIVRPMINNPALKARNTYGRGTRANVIDWKTGRIIECLSQGEKLVFFCLRWNDSVIDIREQVPMDSDLVRMTAEELGLRVPRNELSTDFLVTYHDGSMRAFSIKNSEEDIQKISVAKRQVLEKHYWKRLHVPWTLVYKTDINRIYADNIRICVRYYDPSSVSDRLSLIAHKISRKEIVVDMESAVLDFRALADRYLKEV